jgi:hypothetical protein
MVRQRGSPSSRDSAMARCSGAVSGNFGSIPNPPCAASNDAKIASMSAARSGSWIACPAADATGASSTAVVVAACPGSTPSAGDAAAFAAARVSVTARVSTAVATRVSTPVMRSAGTNVPPAMTSPSAVRNAVVGQPPRLYRSLMSGRRSVSTRTATNRSRMSAATPGSAYVVRSISWHARHHAAVIESSTGFCSRAARANAATLHGSQSIVSSVAAGIDGIMRHEVTIMTGCSRCGTPLC